MVSLLHATINTVQSHVSLKASSTDELEEVSAEGLSFVGASEHDVTMSKEVLGYIQGIILSRAASNAICCQRSSSTKPRYIGSSSLLL